MSRLIVDSGATKSEWCLLRPGLAPYVVTTEGINFAHMDDGHILSVARSAAAQMPTDDVEELYLYAAGAGIYGDDACSVLSSVFAGASIRVYSDLLGAARAVCGHERGVAAILGTGSNSCLYDGENIVRNIHPCGFILGDQGGAAALGKQFLSDYLQERMDEDLARELENSFDVSYATVVANVYRSSAPAAYLGSFAPWIASHYDSSSYVRALVENNFRSFVKDCLARYGEGLRVGIVGSFSYAFSDLVKSIGKEYSLEIDTFLKSPVDGLIKYHAYE